jgi:HupE / UreJ protein
MKIASGVALAIVLLAASAQAHRASDAFLTVEVDGSQLRGRFEIALRDLAAVIDIDPDRDGEITWGELRRARPAIDASVERALAVGADGQACSLRSSDLQVSDRVEGRFAWIELAGQCPAAPAQLSLEYRLLFDVDPTHRGILVLTSGGVAQSAIFAPERARIRLRVAAASRWRQFRDYLAEGVHHIWIGADHILFLISLLLPCALAGSAGPRRIRRLPPELSEVLAVVTAFTAAHSITLALAATGVVRLPTALTESAIALSVMFAALNNVVPLIVRARCGVAFGFGLVHGFGFASVLGELGLPSGARLLALVAFNLGVEVGQLAIVALVFPPAYALRNTAFYRTAVLAGGSLAIGAIAGWWFLQRCGLLAVL